MSVSGLHDLANSVGDERDLSMEAMGKCKYAYGVLREQNGQRNSKKFGGKLGG